jgi:hypothetical protein
MDAARERWGPKVGIPCAKPANALAGAGGNPGLQTYVDFDMGVEGIKAVEAVRDGNSVRVLRHACVAHDERGRRSNPPSAPAR